jgi:hypothetical protein
MVARTQRHRSASMLLAFVGAVLLFHEVSRWMLPPIMFSMEGTWSVPHIVHRPVPSQPWGTQAESLAAELIVMPAFILLGGLFGRWSIDRFSRLISYHH